jgi:drug/metabolite transporter (DMT)-like permease
MQNRSSLTERQSAMLLLLGAVFISYAPIFVKWVGPERVGPTAIGFWRTLFGAATLFLIATVRGSSLRLDARLARFAALAGFAFFLDLFAYHRSVFYCGAGVATILSNTQVFATGLIGFLLFKDRLTVRYLVSTVSAVFGVVLLVGMLSADVTFTPVYIYGLLFGAATGVTYSGYLITIKLATQREGIPDVVAFMAWTSLTTATCLGVSGIVESAPMLPPDWSSLGLLAALGVVAQAMGWWTITTALANVTASRAGLILLMQPTLAVVWGMLFFGERLAVEQMAGAIITLTAIYFGGLRSSRPDSGKRKGGL